MSIAILEALTGWRFVRFFAFQTCTTARISVADMQLMMHGVIQPPCSAATVSIVGSYRVAHPQQSCAVSPVRVLYQMYRRLQISPA